MAKMRFRGMPLWLNIILITLGVLVCLALVFLAYSGITALVTGEGFVDTMSNAWCTIFGIAQSTTEEVVEVVPEVVETVEEVAAARLII